MVKTGHWKKFREGMRMAQEVATPPGKHGMFSQYT